jgi:UDP-galactopyranose mutase
MAAPIGAAIAQTPHALTLRVDNDAFDFWMLPWNRPDEELVAQGTRELHRLGLISAPEKVEAGYVVRMPKAYPMYDNEYKGNVETLRKWLEANTPNVHPVGRNGMHKYNNQDHSMLTAMHAVDGIAAGHVDKKALWDINTEQEYHEEKK